MPCCELVANVSTNGALSEVTEFTAGEEAAGYTFDAMKGSMHAVEPSRSANE